MGIHSEFDAKKLNSFEKSYDENHQDHAEQVRGEFLESFPLVSLNRLDLENYAIGHQKPTFCSFVEAKTGSWANIQGATAFKFGIYFGKTNNDPQKIYRYAKKFGTSAEGAFRIVKNALLELIKLGESKKLDFPAIDANPLSQMFKAKILSLYFPDKFLNVCSRDHLETLGAMLGYADHLPASEYQHLLLDAKRSNPITKEWSNPKFMVFLYDVYVREVTTPEVEVIQKPLKKTPKKVNFEDIDKNKKLIGEIAEKYALNWERQRLLGANLEHLIDKIDDRRDRPGYGYDFLSYTTQIKKRYVEVKSVRKLAGGFGYQFFLSDNEYSVSKEIEHQDSYFFYLVFFGSNMEPIRLETHFAKDFYKKCDMSAASYRVIFDLVEK